jgi:AraC-like DNA-binding protein
MRIVENKPLCEDIDIDENFFFELLDIKEKFKTIDERALTSIVGDFVKLLTSCQQRCSKNPREENLLVDAACAFLGSNFNEECDLKKFCRKQGIGYENFRKIFKKQIGISPWQYRIRRRLDLACALLREPNVRISEIAHELGYVTAYDFSAQFKKYFKTSPAFYRDGRTQ